MSFQHSLETTEKGAKKATKKHKNAFHNSYNSPPRQTPPSNDCPQINFPNSDDRSPNSAGMSSSDVETGFAKLQGKDFEYYMQTYSIILGRNSKKSSVDIDLSSLSGGMNISRHHARVFYDFHRHCFALEVLDKNCCFVEGILHLLGGPIGLATTQ